ncbi:MAG TPA: methionyl-tRNA formyltransferase [Gammaproteobacteria bacterium]
MAEAHRIAFAGTPEFAVPALERLVSLGHAVPLVVTQPDRPAGRGRVLTPSPVKRAALAAGLRVVQPASLKDPALAAELGPPPELMIVAAYGLLLPPWLLAWPKRGCVNLHASLLPRWRGAAPIQHAILAGDAVTGISVMRMEAGLDTGPVYARAEVAIGPRETAGELHDRLAALAAEVLADTLPGILDGRLAPEPQDERLATYAPKLGKADAPLPWRAPAVELERRVRAFNPWPVAEGVLTDGRRLRIWQAAALPDAGGGAAPGTVLAAGPAGIDVATGAGALRLERVQAPGGRAIPAAAYLAAHPLAPGASFVC